MANVTGPREEAPKRSALFFSSLKASLRAFFCWRFAYDTHSPSTPYTLFSSFTLCFRSRFSSAVSFLFLFSPLLHTGSISTSSSSFGEASSTMGIPVFFEIRIFFTGFFGTLFIIPFIRTHPITFG